VSSVFVEEQVKVLIGNLLRDEAGQDLIEYTLLLGFVALASAGLFINAGKSVKGIWSITNSQLAVANTLAS
jgi:Flp pilus assembly pilin Flp